MATFVQSITVLNGLVQSGTAALIDSDSLAPTGVIAGPYNNANIVLDASGRIVAASDGSIGQTISERSFWPV